MSPAGSCMLAMLQGLGEKYRFRAVAGELDLGLAPADVHWKRVPLPQGPSLARYVIYQLLAPLVWRTFQPVGDGECLRIATEGEYGQCDISYAHFCHKAHLRRSHTRLRRSGGLREAVRWMTHCFCAKQEAKAFRNAQMIVVPSARAKYEVQDAYPQLRNKTITIIPNPVDVAHFSRPEGFSWRQMRSTLGLNSDDLVAVFVALGNFHHKGLTVLLEALAAGKTQQTQLLVVGGTGTEIRTYQHLAARLGVSSKVIFVGRHSDIRPFLWCADVFVLPSTSESCSLAALQAAAAGLPLLVSRVGVAEELVEQNVSGWFVLRDAHFLADLILRLSSKRSLLPVMGAAAREAASRYDLRIFWARWDEVLRELNCA